MIQRCTNEKVPNYSSYGAKGVTVCDEWKNDLMSFYNWAIKNGYKDNLSIEDLAGTETYRKLKNWIDSANPSTLNTNHFDFKRWCDFIFTAHSSKSELTSTQFERYLIEDEKFYDEELVSKFALEYEYSLHLLKEYDNR